MHESKRSYPRFRAFYLVQLVMAVNWVVGCGIWTLAGGGVPSAAFAILALPWGYYALAGVINRVSIACGAGRLEIRHGPMPWPGNATVPRSDIESVLVKFHDGQGEYSDSWSVVATPTPGFKEGRVVVARVRDEATAEMMAAQINAWIGGEASAAPVGTLPVEARGSAAASKSVLLVHGSETPDPSLARALASQGLSVGSTSDAKQCIALVRHTRPDVVILWVDLAAGQDGYIVCGQLKKDSSVKNIPVVLLGDPAGFANHRKLSFRAEDYFALPVDLPALAQRAAVLARATSAGPGDAGFDELLDRLGE